MWYIYLLLDDADDELDTRGELVGAVEDLRGLVPRVVVPVDDAGGPGGLHAWWEEGGEEESAGALDIIGGERHMRKRWGRGGRLLAVSDMAFKFCTCM
jgi:hypothetical protein